jgi:uncharacterized protein
MRWIRLFLLAPAIGLGAGTLLATYNALHVPWRTLPPFEAADTVSRRTDSTWADIQVTAADGVVLDGWLFTPRQPNGSAVIAVHGVADTRLGMLAHAEFLLRGGFTVLVPDCRGHGRSGDTIITYGIREAGDVRCWSNRLQQDPALHRLYGIGQSMGAAILLQSLITEPRFRAIVADCPFATFEEISYERLQQVSGLPKFAFWPIVRLGFLYTNLAYGVNLDRASPLDAVRATRVPVLLIHGTADTNIPPHHSQQLHAINPAATELWMVPGAEHVSSLAADPQTYAAKVIAWFNRHT